MQIVILNPEQFIQYRKHIGVMLHTSADSSKINLFTGDQHFVIQRNEIKIPSLEILNKKLIFDEPLRELALEHEFIEIHDQDRSLYLNYANIYN